MIQSDSTGVSSMMSSGIPEKSTLDFLGVPLFDGESLMQLLLRFSFNFLICGIIIHFLYYRKSGRRDYYFTFVLFSVTIFLLIFLLDNVKLQIGFALGLFAIFGMIRYRTESVPIREMTYLFMIIGISVINGLAMTVSYAEILCTNLLFLLVTWVLESNKVLKHTAYKVILYERIKLIVPDKEEELKEDLEKRTGLNILKIEIGNIDFLRDVAYIKVYYSPKEKGVITNTVMSGIRPLDY